MKKAFVVTAWFATSIVTLSVSAYTIRFLRRTQQLTPYMNDKITGQSLLSPNQKSPEVAGISSQINVEDARPVIIAQFLERYHSPLQPAAYWGQYLTNIADKYGLDFRLLPAIAMQESNLCKNIPEDSHNCLGLGIHKRGTWGFSTYEDNFEKAAEVLRKNYINQGLITPDEIQNKYTPTSNGSWEFSVNKFMDKLETADF